MFGSYLKNISGALILLIMVAGCASIDLSATPSIAPTAITGTTTSPEPFAYWSAESWRVATPEEQGIDSRYLADMLNLIREEKHNIHSVSIVRNGFLVLDAYYHPYNPDTRHIIHSCTKSIVSALIGIAIHKGFIASTDQSILNFFPDETVANLDSDKESITIEDLLTMSSGLECRDSYLYNWKGLNEMRASDDWAKHMLELPMADPPGSRFEYCNGGSYLLSAIVQQTTGKTALEFAKQNLFRPLGISDVDWPANRDGVNYGWGEMSLKPQDMAKFGNLYLNLGRWNDQQILPEEWVRESTSAHIFAGTLSDSYGYQWWIDNNGYVMALGYAGQYIIVLPEQNMVVVFTSDLASEDFFLPETLLNEYILPAVNSSDPLPANEAAYSRLQALIEDASKSPGP